MNFKGPRKKFYVFIFNKTYIIKCTNMKACTIIWNKYINK